MPLSFVQTEVAESGTVGFAGNEFTEPLKDLPVRHKGEKGKSLSFVVAYKTKEDMEKAEAYLAAIARNSTADFSVAKRLHRDYTLDAKTGVRTSLKGSAVIEFWKAEKITRKRTTDSVTTSEPEK